MKFMIEVADLLIEVESVYPQLVQYCKDYRAEAADGRTPDFSVLMTKEEIAACHAGLLEPSSMEFAEKMLLLRKLAEQLPFYHRFYMHGAAITYENDAYIFTAPSGTGKTTHISLWRKYLGSAVDIINGDKPFLSVEPAGGVTVYGTPWAGKEGWQKNRSAAVRGICFLRQAKENHIRKLQPFECVQLLLQQIFVSRDVKSAELTLELIDGLMQRVPCYLLECNREEEAVRMSFETLTGRKMEESSHVG